MQNLVVVVLDSLRFDAWQQSATPNIDRLGPVQRRWSYASWTAPSHYNLVMGLMPHDSPSGVYASEHYKRDFERYRDRLGIESFEFRKLLPGLNLPRYLQQCGYYTGARVSMPVLNPATPLNTGFSDYRLMPQHNDFAAIVDSLEFPHDQPCYWLLNVGETHYPYATAGEDPADWPRISGLHGVLKRLGDSDGGADDFFDSEQLAGLRQRQIDALSSVDTIMAALFDRIPSGTWVVVTSDHGELFGEDDYFGHGPIMHPKVFEVPFVEGRLR